MADFKQKDVASSALTITLASLASDSSLLAGRQSTVIDNSSNQYLDYLVSGKITAGTSPTAAKSIEVWAFATADDAPVYPDQFGASDAGVTPTSRDILANACALVASIPTDSTSNRTYWFRPTSIAALFGGVLPKKFGLFVVHNTGVNLNSTGSNHAIYSSPRYATVG